jgi:hypothetical protein
MFFYVILEVPHSFEGMTTVKEIITSAFQLFDISPTFYDLPLFPALF